MKINNAVKESKYYEKKPNKVVKCTMCPRECVLKDGAQGFCKVKENKDGILFNTNHGITTYLVVEPIETNAIFHYKPGINALSFGSIGCNMDCEFCQAHEYSRAESANISKFDYHEPEDIVRIAKNLGLKDLAFTFNDPISSFEFVLEVSRLAKAEGMTCLFKSSHFINPEPLRELAQYVDIFAVSVKSIRQDYYTDICHGLLQPVLDNAIMLKKLGKHVEICNLVVTNKNDSEKDFRDLAIWVKTELGVDTPLHYARYHPDYKFTEPRTPIALVDLAIEVSKKVGIRHAYSGNVFAHHGLNTYCYNCNHELVHRVGENPTILNEDAKKCDKCGTPHEIIFDNSRRHRLVAELKTNDEIRNNYSWDDDEVWAFHLQLMNPTDKNVQVTLKHEYTDGSVMYEYLVSPKNMTVRYAISRTREDHCKTKVMHDGTITDELYSNEDRAFYRVPE